MQLIRRTIFPLDTAFRAVLPSRVPSRERESERVISTDSQPGGWRVLALAATLGLAIAAPGCGDDGGGSGGQSDHPADDPELITQAQQKIERAAAASGDRAKDRYIPGPKRYEVVCLTPEMARQKNVGADFIQCHVEAFSTPSKKKRESVYVESEDWRVPVQPEGGVGEPVIVDGYRIADFLRRDNRLGCSVGKTVQDTCKSPFAQNPSGG